MPLRCLIIFLCFHALPPPLPEPFQRLDIMVARMAGVTKQSGCCECDDRHYRVHSGNKLGFVPSQIAQSWAARPKVL